jgi:hypothetical protein
VIRQRSPEGQEITRRSDVLETNLRSAEGHAVGETGGTRKKRQMDRLLKFTSFQMKIGDKRFDEIT